MLTKLTKLSSLLYKVVYNKLDNLVNLVSRMSLGKRLDDVNLLGSVVDKMNQNVMSRCQSMMINEEQHLINDDEGRMIRSVLDESTCSKWAEQVEEKQ